MSRGDEPVLGLQRRQVRLADPDPRWAGLFAEEAARLADALRSYDAVVEHCGSTAVPGMPAKPILDILVGVPGQLDVQGLARVLGPLGYDHAPNAVPDHEAFGRGDPRTHLLHVAPIGGAPWRGMLVFRDALRADPALAAEYAALKRELAACFPADRPSYTAAKAEFIARVVARADGD